MNKDIVFFSNYCSFSKDVVSKLSKSPIHDNLIYLCVDDKNIKLPNFISVVPTIYLNKDKKILVDEEITNWIEKNSNKNEDLMAYHGNSVGNSGFSTSFSFLNEENSDSMIARYSFLDNDDNITTPKEFSKDNSVKTGMDSALEKLQQERNNESFSQGISRI